MDAQQLVPLAMQILAGAALAACCGLRAFLPPFLVGLAARTGVTRLAFGDAFSLNPAFDWLASSPALVVFGVAVVFEIAADKIPAVDHALDLVQTWVRPIAGALVVASTLTDLDPLWATVVGLVLGGSVAGGVHVAKAQIRLLSTLGTGGIASPVLSLIEDLLALVGSALAIVATLLAVVLIAVGLMLTWSLVRRFRRRAGRFAAR
ncbi:MAG: DUF4126 domain-containing protein [Acidobacteriota bacterium]|nr:MAG: DUF4126 domain-containing protein [Acidobacteriota bacterium]